MLGQSCFPVAIASRGGVGLTAFTIVENRTVRDSIQGGCGGGQPPHERLKKLAAAAFNKRVAPCVSAW